MVGWRGCGGGGISTFFYQQKGLLLDSVRFSCPRLLLLVPVKQKVVFTLWLMLKGYGAVVGATYGLPVRAERFKKRSKDGKMESETDTDGVLGFPCAPPSPPPRLFSQPLKFNVHGNKKERRGDAGLAWTSKKKP